MPKKSRGIDENQAAKVTTYLNDLAELTSHYKSYGPLATYYSDNDSPSLRELLCDEGILDDIYEYIDQKSDHLSQGQDSRNIDSFFTALKKVKVDYSELTILDIYVNEQLFKHVVKGLNKETFIRIFSSMHGISAVLGLLDNDYDD